MAGDRVLLAHHRKLGRWLQPGGHSDGDPDERCRQWGVAPSMGSVGDCYDNAMAEGFFATLECEMLDHTRFHDRRQAQRAIFEFLEDWYNPHRRHQGLGYQSPIDFEKSYQDAA